MIDTAIGTRVIRALRGGQVTLPAEFRRALEIDEGSLLTVSMTDSGELILRPVNAVASEKGSPYLKEIYEMFAPARQEAIDKGYTGEEIDQWIDEAVAEVRRERRLNGSTIRQ